MSNRHTHRTVAKFHGRKTSSSRIWSYTILLLLLLLIVIPSGAPAIANAQADSSVPLLVKFKASAKNSDIDAALRANGGQSVRALSQIRTHVIAVSANARDRILAAYARHPSVERATAAVKLKKSDAPNDPNYAQQWALPKIAWDQAYSSVAVSGSATIAVLDTGVDATHPDLAGRIAAGQSFVGGDPNSDPHGHGTALAGIAAANVNDGIGIAGVAYGPVSVSSVQVLQSDGTGYDSDVVAGVLWAADNGANVILMGFSSADYSAALADALAYAWGKGVVLVAATGNDGSSAPSYPAGMPNVLGAAATDENDEVGANSNLGSALVAAPGVGIYTTQTGGGYGSVSGTSAASAHVAGLAALLVANGNSNSYIFDQIRGATDPVADQTFGRINILTALGAPVMVTPVTPGETPTPGTPTYVIAATRNINFATSGLPSGVSITISGSRTNPGGIFGSYLVTFTSPGPSASIGTRDGTSFTYSGFPASVTVSGVTYTLVSTVPSSPFTTPSGAGTTTVTATYVVACTAPSVTTNPTNQTVTYGANASFTAAASGSPAPTVQWQVDTGSGFTDIGGATSTTLNVTAPTVSQSGNQYRAVFTNSCGSATSSAATLTVNKATVTPHITADNKVYDGNTSATVLTRSTVGDVAA
jgi:thermitase